MILNRRQLLGLLSSGTFLLSAGVQAAIKLTGSPQRLRFPQGVASGDPQPDGVMLWTRAEPESPSDTVALSLQVAQDPDFSELVLQTALSTDKTSDYTLRIFVDNLNPARTYYYRFLGEDGSLSVTGRTRTAPLPDAEAPVKVALASCQNYESGFYGSWARMLADDLAADDDAQIDFVMHVGDFIYERIFRQRYRGGDQPRLPPPFPDGGNDGRNDFAVSLADYRHLYKTYLSDPHLQAARARWPFVCTWDDHEFSNNGFQSYSTYNGNNRPDPQRKLNANQAWFEFIPMLLSDARTGGPAHDFVAGQLGGDEAEDNNAAVDSLCIYRRLRWGKLLDVVITDNRSYRSAQCLTPDFHKSLGLPMNTLKLVEIADGGREYNDGKPPEFLPYGDAKIPNPARRRPAGTILGEVQKEWFLEQLKMSGATWKVWGNSMPALPFRIDLPNLPSSDYEDSVFSIDSWTGYPHELRVLLEFIGAAGITGVVSLSGDHHIHAAGVLKARQDVPGSPPVCAEFSTTCISAESMYEDAYNSVRKDNEEFAPLVYRLEDGEEIPVWNLTLQDGVAAAMSYQRDDAPAPTPRSGSKRTGIRYVDSNAQGYTIAMFSATEVKVEMVTMTDVTVPFDQAPATRRRAFFNLPVWAAGEEPLLSGPDFAGSSPFPYDVENIGDRPRFPIS